MVGLKASGEDEEAYTSLAPKGREIYITRLDYTRLKELVSVARLFGDNNNVKYLDRLENDLRQSRIVDPRSVPADVVTMNSRVLLVEVDSGQSRAITLVFPVDAEGDIENISILEHLGTSLIGACVGNIVEAGTEPAKKYRVQEILYQPEASGDFHR